MIRIRHRTLGGHVHCRIFTGKGEGYTFQLAGAVVLDAGPMWDDFRASMPAAQFLEEESPVSPIPRGGQEVFK